jgi:2',3'-cyclic-nucleotide 2'-phosphodiesterase (5'-nucleotidase family)
MARLIIFHTSDMHNKLTPALADRLRGLKADCPNSLMLDSGDAIWAGNVFWRPGGEPVLDLMNAVPYDAMCMGNREFHFLGVGVDAKTSRAAFPVLSANLRAAKPTRKPPARAYEVFERGGVQIGVMGLSVPSITERMLVKKVSDYFFTQPIAAATEVVPRLRAECDMLIALTHIGIKQDRELAESVDGIDLILGGHTHIVTPEPERVGRTWLLHHGSHAHFVGKVSIEIDSGHINVTNEMISLAKA